MPRPGSIAELTASPKKSCWVSALSWARCHLMKRATIGTHTPRKQRWSVATNAPSRAQQSTQHGLRVTHCHVYRAWPLELSLQAPPNPLIYIELDSTCSSAWSWSASRLSIIHPHRPTSTGQRQGLSPVAAILAEIVLDCVPLAWT